MKSFHFIDASYLVIDMNRKNYEKMNEYENVTLLKRAINLTADVRLQ